MFEDDMVRREMESPFGTQTWSTVQDSIHLETDPDVYWQ